MLWNASALRGFAIEATDGQIGTVSDLLFDDLSWQLRWVVVHTGSWLLGHKVLLPLTALRKPERATSRFTVQLTRQQVQDSPNVTTDLPVSRHMEARIYHHYDWNPYWRSGFSSIANSIGTPASMPRSEDIGPRRQNETDAMQPDGDPNLRSIIAVTGYHIEARDGAIGHAEDFIISDAAWHIRYVTVDTKNWLPGQRVVIVPQMIHEINWVSRSIFVDADVALIKGSPPYDPDMTEDGPFNDRFKEYFGLKIEGHEDLDKLKIGN